MNKYLIEHHYGWVETNETPYEHLRRTHSFLTDDNHAWEDEGDCIVIRRNDKSPAQHPLTPEWAKDDFWFSLPYKVIHNSADEQSQANPTG